MLSEIVLIKAVLVGRMGHVQEKQGKQASLMGIPNT